MKTKIIGLSAFFLCVALLAAAHVSSRGDDISGVSNYVFAQAEGSPVLSLVDMRTDEFVGQIELPSIPGGILISQSLQRIVYVPQGEARLVVYDLEARGVEAEFNLDFIPESLLLSPDGFQAAVMSDQLGSLQLVLLEKKEVFPAVAELYKPSQATYSASSEYLYVVDGKASEVVILDAFDGQRLDPIPLVADGKGVARSLSSLSRTPDSRFGVLVDEESGTMPLISFQLWEQINTIDVGQDPQRPYITADGRYVIVPSASEKMVSVLSSDTFSIVTEFPTTGRVSGVATGFFESIVVLPSSESNLVSIVDLEGMVSLDTVDVGGAAGLPIADADGRRVYIPVPEDSKIVVYDTFGKKITTTLFIDQGNDSMRLFSALTNNYCH